jgi:hypothetical protein
MQMRGGRNVASRAEEVNEFEVRGGMRKAKNAR